MQPKGPKLSAFGQMLRIHRDRLGLSQAALAHAAESTARYVSFIETGRSRPSRNMVARLAECLALSQRDKNRLLSAAGLPTDDIEYQDTQDQHGKDFKASVQAVLDNHLPYPGCAVDTFSRIKMTNQCFRTLFSSLVYDDPEESIDAFFAPRGARDFVKNWAELAWALYDRRQLEAARTNNARLLELSKRTRAHLEGVPRPKSEESKNSMVIHSGFHSERGVINTYSTVLRFERVADIALSELRVELIYPADENSKRFFQQVMQP